MQSLEARSGGRLGVMVRDAHHGREWAYRADERFMLLSSFKCLLVAMVLSLSDHHQLDLSQRLVFTTKHLQAWSPVTERHLGSPGMRLTELCEDTLTTSDNTAANLLLDQAGGPMALTRFLRRMGDPTSRLDRHEPELNRPQGLMDTTTPRAMLNTLQKLLIGPVLSAHSREQLRLWMQANQTGHQRIEAGLPPGWQIADKTGTNDTDANDVAWVKSPQGTPWLVTVYVAGSRAPLADKERVMAEVGALLGRL